MAGRHDGFLYATDDAARQQLVFTEEELRSMDFLQSEQHIADSHLHQASPLTVDDLSQGTPELTPTRPLPRPLPNSSTPKAGRMHHMGHGWKPAPEHRRPTRGEPRRSEVVHDYPQQRGQNHIHHVHRTRKVTHDHDSTLEAMTHDTRSTAGLDEQDRGVTRDHQGRGVTYEPNPHRRTPQDGPNRTGFTQSHPPLDQSRHDLDPHRRPHSRPARGTFDGRRSGAIPEDPYRREVRSNDPETDFTFDENARRSIPLDDQDQRGTDPERLRRIIPLDDQDRRGTDPEGLRKGSLGSDPYRRGSEQKDFSTDAGLPARGSNNNSVTSECSLVSQVLPDRGHSKYAEGVNEDENEELRQKLQQMRRSNAELMTANHDLLNQLETLEHQQRQTRHKMSQLSTNVGEKDAQLTEIKNQLSDREQDLHRVHAALQQGDEERRVWDENHKDLQTQLEQSSEKMNILKEHIQILTVEVANANKLKDRAESECSRALHAAEAMQVSVEDYHRKTQDRVQQYETAEMELKIELDEAGKRLHTLEEQAQDVRAERDDLCEEVSRFKEENSSERKSRMATEQENLDLRTQISKLTARITGKQDGNTSVSSELHRQKIDLERSVSRLTRQLQESREDCNEMKQKLDQALACRESLLQDPSDSGVDFDATPSVIQQLRDKLAARDREVARLRDSLEESTMHRDTDSRGRLNSNDRKIEELELLIQGLEEERGRYAAKFLSLEERKTELELQNSSLTAKLLHWTQQGEELQGELNEVNGNMVTMERQLRKAQNEAGSFQRDVEDRTEENALLVARNKTLEKECQDGVLDSQQLHSELEMLSAKILQLESEKNDSRRKQTQDKHATELEMVELRHTAEQKELELRKTLTDMDRVAQDLNAKQMTIVDLQHELRIARDEGKQALVTVEQKAAYTSGQVQELQTALSVCKNDLQAYMDQMSQSQSQHEQIAQQKSNKITELIAEVSSLKQTIAEKESQLTDVGHQAASKRELLEQESARLEQMEQGQSILHTQITVLQEELEQERTQWELEKGTLLQEAESLQDSLRAAQNTVEQKEQACRDKSRQTEDLKGQLASALEDVEDLRTQLEDAQTDTQQAEDHNSELETQLRDTKNNMRNCRHKLESVEEDVAQLREELDGKTKKATSLTNQLHAKNQELGQTKLELEAAKEEVEDVSEHLSQHRATLLDKEKQLTQLTNKYSAQQESIHYKDQELEQLRSTLQQQQIQLQQRSGQVTQLDVCLKEHQNQMEQRLTTLEAALKQSQLEAQQRSNQVGLLDEQVGLLKEQLREKELQLEQASKTSSRQQVQIHSNTDTITALQQQIQTLKSQLVKVKEENQELQKELDATRDEESRLQQELTQAQCESSLSQRQQERINSQLQDALQQCQKQKNNASSLSEALELLNIQKVQLESKQDSSKRQMQMALEAIKGNYQQQVDSLKSETSKVASNLEQQQRTLRQDLQDAKDQERHLVLELQTTRAELEQRSLECSRLRDSVLGSNQSGPVKDTSVPDRSVERSHLRPVASYSERMSANQVFPMTQAYSDTQQVGSSLIRHHLPNTTSSNYHTAASSDSLIEVPGKKPGPGGFDGRLGLGGPSVTQAQQNTGLRFSQEIESKSGGPPALWQKDFQGGYQQTVQSVPRNEPTLTSDLPGSDALPSQLMSCSISDISKADNASGRFVVSETGEPDSLQSMLYEVRKITNGDQSEASDDSKKSKSKQPAGRLFGAKAWPTSRSTSNPKLAASSSSTTSAHGGKGAPPKKSVKPSKSKGPLHSSPQSDHASKSVFGSSRSQKPSGTVPASKNNQTKPHRGLPSSSKGQASKTSKTFPKAPDFLSPNISSAITHYDFPGEITLEDLLPGGKASGLTGDSDDGTAAGNETIDTNASQEPAEFLPSGLDLDSRRKALQAMQDELKGHITAVNKHLGS